MPIVFIDGPDFSGKTHTAKQAEHYREWSSSPSGIELRKYFMSAKATKAETVTRAIEMWNAWAVVGNDTTDILTIDRSPISTLAEQVIGDKDSLRPLYLEAMRDLVITHGSLCIKFISVSDELLRTREQTAGRGKDARELLRDVSQRNALYHIAFMALSEYLPTQGLVVDVSVEGDLITLQADREDRTGDIPLSNFLGVITLTSRTECPPSAVNNLVHRVPDLGGGGFNLRTVRTALLVLDDVLTQEDHHHQGGDYPNPDTVMSIVVNGDVLGTGGDKLTTKYSLDLVGVLSDRIKQASTANSMGLFTLGMFNALVKEPTEHPRDNEHTPYEALVLAAYFLIQYYEEIPPWNIT